MSRSRLLAGALSIGLMATASIGLAASPVSAAVPQDIAYVEHPPEPQNGWRHCAKIEVVYARGTDEPAGHSWALNGYYFSPWWDPYRSDRHAPHGIWFNIAKELINKPAPGTTGLNRPTEYVAKYDANASPPTPGANNTAGSPGYNQGLSDLVLYHVPYPATTDFMTNASTNNSLNQGTKTLINHLNAENVRCPNKKFLLFGYSQGALVVANTISASSKRVFWYESGNLAITEATRNKVVSVGLFADAQFNGNAKLQIDTNPATPTVMDGNRWEYDTAAYDGVTVQNTPWTYNNGTDTDVNGRRNAGSFVQGWHGLIGPRADDAFLPGFEKKVRNFCIYRDPVCQGGPTVNEHLFYFVDGKAKLNLLTFAVRKLRQSDPRWTSLQPVAPDYTNGADYKEGHPFPQAGLPNDALLTTAP